MVLLAEISFLTHLPLLFPSLGPTAISVITRPALRQNRPASLIGGHFFGAGVALSLLFLFGIYGAPSTLEAGFTQTRILVVALSIGITTIFEEETPLYHPPAAATTLLVSLGVMSTPIDVISILIGVVLLTIGAAIYEYLCPKAPKEEVRKDVVKKAMA